MVVEWRSVGHRVGVFVLFAGFGRIGADCLVCSDVGVGVGEHVAGKC